MFPDNNKLQLDDDEHYIEPLAMDVLTYFCQNPDKVVSRDELIEAIWNGRIVGDHAVYRIINKLRQTLAVDSSVEYIKTIRKKGYQLVTSVSAIDLHGQPQTTSENDTTNIDKLSAGETDAPYHAPLKAAGSKQFVRNRFSRFFIKELLITALLIALAYSVGKLYFYYSIDTFNKSVPLVTMEGQIKDPAFSPDGKYIAFSYKENSKDDWNLYIESLVDGRVRQLTNFPTDELSPAWSSDGLQLGYIRYDNQSCVIEAVSAPQNVTADKAQGEYITDCVGVLQQNDLEWGKGGKFLYFSQAENKVSPIQIFKLTIQTGKVKQLTNYSQGETRGALGFKVSPDNSKLAILKDKNWRDSSIEILDLTTHDTKNVRNLVGWNRFFDWSSDSESVIYSRNSKEVDAYHLNLGIEKNILKSVDDINFPIHSPLETELAVVSARKVVEIVSEPLGGESTVEDEPYTVVSSSSIDNYAEYANTSNKIAFISRRSGEAQVWVKDIDGSEKQLTNFTNNFEIQRIRWSPNDEQLLFIHNNMLKMLSLNSSAPRVLYKAESGEVIEGESWASKEAVLFSSNRDGDWQVYKLELGEYESIPKALTIHGGYSAIPSPDGEGIIYLKYHSNGLWYKPYSSDEERMIIENIDIFSFNSVYLRQGSLYYLSDKFPKMEIYRYDFDNKKPTFVQQYFGSPWLLSISHDARRVLYQRNNQAHSSLILLRP
ncbi:winged helix-turn-helix domain-containing protein [Kangiella japonica]|uniref:winged helix-turn-helix domain-containing protein n=1 Tax=Kangiella japonica TaxID=647384 RepID=UPI0031CEC108